MFRSRTIERRGIRTLLESQGEDPFRESERGPDREDKEPNEGTKPPPPGVHRKNSSHNVSIVKTLERTEFYGNNIKV